LYNLVSQHNLGYIAEPDNYPSLSKLISALKPDESFEVKRKNALSYATQYLDINNVMNSFVDNVFK
jgi:colanic acid biosynthesis glycosyl transferase WcaI